MSLDPVAFLERADAVWRDYCAQMPTVRAIFLYLDRTFVISLPGLRSIFDMGLQLLRSHLEAHPQVQREARRFCGLRVCPLAGTPRGFGVVREKGSCAGAASPLSYILLPPLLPPPHGRHPTTLLPSPSTPPPPGPAKVEARIVRGLLQLVERERHGEAVDRALLASLLRMLKDLGLYQGRFEAPFLAETGAFYRAEAAAKVADCDTAAYLAHCEVGAGGEGAWGAGAGGGGGWVGGIAGA